MDSVDVDLRICSRWLAILVEHNILLNFYQVILPPFSDNNVVVNSIIVFPRTILLPNLPFSLKNGAVWIQILSLSVLLSVEVTSSVDFTVEVVVNTVTVRLILLPHSFVRDVSIDSEN